MDELPDLARVDLGLTAEQAEYRDVLRDLLSPASPGTAAAGPPDAESWHRLCAETGLAGAAIDPAYGGGGGGTRDLAVAFEELGRALATVPALSTVGLAASALTLSGDGEAMERWLPPIAEGHLTATVVWPDGTDRLVAEPLGGDRHRIDGTAAFVLDGSTADLLIVAARAGASGTVLLAVDPGGQSGVVREPLPTFDLTRPFAAVTFRAATGTLVGRADDADQVLAGTLDRARVHLAAEQLGGAAACLESAVAYARTRVQFGRAIGSFQAVKHKCADMLVAVETTRTAVRYAAWAADNAPGLLPAAAAMAQAEASRSFLLAASENLQIHGGLGFTWEHSAHLYLKRAKSMAVFLGGPRDHHRALAGHLGL
ncbi:acyl-CoA dehydrogenase family protein [Actinomadura sp. B10D3]|uniref:acyl-CoA dehydrogenase family protein n=1 Tax=Actinomadura sp. B10D3 TaxID=3153557 RepID=UPI00325E5BE5